MAKQIRSRLTEEEYNVILDYRKRYHGLTKECEAGGLPMEAIDHGWLKTKEWSLHFKTDPQTMDYKAAFQDIIATYAPPSFALPELKETCQKALKVVISDAHVGMDPNPNGDSLFNYAYNAQIFHGNLEKVFTSIVNAYRLHGKFDMLLIDDLGDGLDGWNGETTRGGHKLPQNMTNTESWKAYVIGKLTLIEKCIRAGVANKVIVRNVTNCNHAGDFGEMANTAIQMMLERSYDKGVVDFRILTKFIEHFEYGNHTFIVTHGKDKQYMKHGFKKELTKDAIKFINEYIDHYEIKSKYIHFEKGDLHCSGYDRTKKFDYRNYMSFAPPSSWIQTNFGDTYSGFAIQVVPKYNNEISHTDHYFEYKKQIKAA